MAKDVSADSTKTLLIPQTGEHFVEVSWTQDTLTETNARIWWSNKAMTLAGLTRTNTALTYPSDNILNTKMYKVVDMRNTEKVQSTDASVAWTTDGTMELNAIQWAFQWGGSYVVAPTVKLNLFRVCKQKA